MKKKKKGSPDNTRDKPLENFPLDRFSCSWSAANLHIFISLKWSTSDYFFANTTWTRKNKKTCQHFDDIKDRQMQNRMNMYIVPAWGRHGVKHPKRDDTLTPHNGQQRLASPADKTLQTNWSEGCARSCPAPLTPRPCDVHPLGFCRALWWDQVIPCSDQQN